MSTSHADANAPDSDDGALKGRPCAIIAPSRGEVILDDSIPSSPTSVKLHPAVPTMTQRATVLPEFPGFPDFRANVTFVPLQFFTVVLPHQERGCVRLVGYMIRRLLGWVDSEGNPINEQLQFSYRTLVTEVGISRGGIAAALEDALKNHLIRRVDGADSGVEATYALRWSDRYTDSPDDFDGFFRREAVMLPGDSGESSPPAAKAARKNIPNAFFDYVFRRERLSVVRVVGAMLFKSIRWGPGGERKVPVSLSITELSRLTNFSRHHVHEALQEAMARGYIERMEEGCFDPRAGVQSHAATYQIRWTSQAVNPVFAETKAPQAAGTVESAPFTFLNQSKKVNGEGAQKDERAESKKVNGDRFKKVNDISIKRSIKKQATTAGEPREPLPPVAAAAEGVLAKLLAVGFDDVAARHLARGFPSEVIEQQLAWLPLRRANTNKLGMLRRAIEQNWPKPEVSAPAPEHAAGAVFVRHFEATFHGYAEPPASCSPKEAELAAGFLRELVETASGDAEAASAEWGRRFGLFVRTKSPPKPWFVWLLRMYGGGFLRHSRQSVRRDEKVSLAQSREAHQKHFAARYDEYLRELETSIQRVKPALYTAFEAHREETSTRLKLSEKTRTMLASETSRLSAFVDFLREQGVPVLGFWEWDRQSNPARWSGRSSLDQTSAVGQLNAASSPGEDPVKQQFTAISPSPRLIVRREL